MRIAEPEQNRTVRDDEESLIGADEVRHQVAAAEMDCRSTVAGHG